LGGVGCRVEGLGVVVGGLGVMVYCLGFEVEGAGFRVQVLVRGEWGLGFGGLGSGYRV